jgi:hypothetical protein
MYKWVQFSSSNASKFLNYASSPYASEKPSMIAFPMNSVQDIEFSSDPQIYHTANELTKVFDSLIACEMAKKISA